MWSLSENEEGGFTAAHDFFDLLPTDELKRNFLLELFNQQAGDTSYNPLVMELSKGMAATSDDIKNQIFYAKLLVLTGQQETAQPLIAALMDTLTKQNEYKMLIEMRRYGK